MIDEIKLGNERDRGARAERILTDDLFVQAFAELEKTYLTAWKNTTPTQVPEREALWMGITVLSDVQQHFRLIMQTGKFSHEQLERLQDERQREAQRKLRVA